MTVGVHDRPVSVAELRRAWLAVQAGHFSQPAPGLPMASRRTLASTEVWMPSPGEEVLPILGCTGWAGATAFAVALATASGRSARVVECASASTTGPAAASMTELGHDPTGWTLGVRGGVRLERSTIRSPDPEAIPRPLEAEDPGLTVLDVGHPVDQVLTCAGWLTRVLAEAGCPVLVTRASVPGLRRLESCLDALGHRPVVAAVLGPPLRRWPRQVTASLGLLTRSVVDAKRLVSIPEDRGLAVRGLTSAPLPPALLAAASEALLLTKGPADHAS